MLFFYIANNMCELTIISMKNNGIQEFSFNMLQSNTYIVVPNRKSIAHMGYYIR